MYGCVILQALSFLESYTISAGLVLSDMYTNTLSQSGTPYSLLMLSSMTKFVSSEFRLKISWGNVTILICKHESFSFYFLRMEWESLLLIFNDNCLTSWSVLESNINNLGGQSTLKPDKLSMTPESSIHNRSHLSSLTLNTDIILVQFSLVLYTVFVAAALCQSQLG